MVSIEQRDRLTVPGSDKVLVDSVLSSWAGKATANRKKLKGAGWRCGFGDKLFDLTYGSKRDCGCRLPCIVTGHQANWHSIGVWVKTVMAAKLADKVNGVAVQLVLDHDIYDTALRLPAENKTSVRKNKIAFGDREKVPVEYRKCKEDLIWLLKETKTYFPESVLTKLSLRLDVECDSVAEVITFVMSAINEKFGVDNVLYVPVSKLSEQPEFFKFVMDCLRGAREFAEYYNDAVEQYRINAISKLKISDYIELPFWLYSRDGVRLKLFIKFVNENKIEICAGRKKLGKINLDGILAWQQLRNIMMSENYKLRPCAITLTVFSRLCFADLFIHGIGGQKYEAITDCLLEQFFGLEKTDFVSATAMVNLPLTYELKKPALNQAQIKSRLRAMKFNPENFIDENFRELPAILEMVEKKRDLLKSLACVDTDSKDKKEIHLRISEYNEKLCTYTKNSVLKTQKISQQLESYQRDFEIVNSREYFFGLYSQQKLKEIMQAIVF